MTWSPPSDKLWYPGAQRRPLDGPSIAGSWAVKPLGIIDHFTAGCGDPYGTLQAGKLGVTFFVDSTGKVSQYATMGQWVWHAYSASMHYVGVEHECLPGSCDLTVAQLQASARLNAWILDVLNVPTIRSKGVAFTAGIKAHFDGLENPAAWNPRRHWDGIWKADVSWLASSLVTALNRSPWTATQYLGAVAAARGGKPPAPGDGPPPWPGRILALASPFMKGDDVRTWQTRMNQRTSNADLKIGVDGTFGSDTDRRTRFFQAYNGLTVDGKVGPTTWGSAW
jgi:hypothetical protein